MSESESILAGLSSSSSILGSGDAGEAGGDLQMYGADDAPAAPPASPPGVPGLPPDWRPEPEFMATFGIDPEPVDVHATAASGVAGAGGPLPHLDAIQRAFGSHDLGAVQAHVGGEAANAAGAIGADAYATGSHVAFASEPSLFVAAHEAAHVVQQQGGVQLHGGVGQAGDAHEQHADAVAARVVAGRSAADLLGASARASAPTSAVQRFAPILGPGDAMRAAGDAIRQAHPIAVEPTSASFGEQAVSDKGHRYATLKIKNVHPKATWVEFEPSFEGPQASAFSFDRGGLYGSLEKDGADFVLADVGSLPLQFRPTEIGPNKGTLVLRITGKRGEGTGRIEIPLDGMGREDNYQEHDAEKIAAIKDGLADKDNEAAKQAATKPEQPMSSGAQADLAQIPTLMEQILRHQVNGLENLQRDLASKDEPSVTDRLIETAVDTALTYAFGALGALGAKVIDGLSSSGKEEPSGTAQRVSSYVHTKMASVVIADIHRDADSPSLRKFIGEQRGALERGADQMADTFTETRPLLTTVEKPEADIRAVRDSLRSERDSADGVQYMRSLAEWSNSLAGGSSYHSPEQSVDDPDPLGHSWDSGWSGGAQHTGEVVITLAKLHDVGDPVEVKSATWQGVGKRTVKAVKKGVSEAASHDKGSTPDTAVANGMTIGDLGVVVRVVFEADEINEAAGTQVEREYAFEKYPDDADPVVGWGMSVDLAKRILAELMTQPIGSLLRTGNP